MARGGAVLGETMTSTLTPWLTGVCSTFLSDDRFQQRNNNFHKGAFLEYSPPPLREKQTKSMIPTRSLCAPWPRAPSSTGHTCPPPS